MACKSGRRNAVALLACGLLMGPAMAATPSATDALAGARALVTLPRGESSRASAVAVRVPEASVRITPSKLVTRRDLEFSRAEAESSSARLTFLMHNYDGARVPRPVAVVSSFRLGDKEHIWIQRMASTRSGVEGVDVAIATIEHLYGLALEQNPHARFCLSGFGHTCTTPGDDYAHPTLLREIAEARDRIISRTHRSVASVPWRNVTMASEPITASGDRVAVRVSLAGNPLQGATVIFNRAPHSGCKAKSASDGVASCDLVDQHGDEDPDEDKTQVPILATFPGDVRSDQILLPTTLTWGPGR